MAAVDLLEELQLNDYYPQKLSFSEAIKLRGKLENGCQEQYGVEIIRRLLVFDSTAVVSVTTEINERLRITDARRVKTSFRALSKSGKSERKIHPMDVLVAVMNCCDDFLRQALVERMVASKLSIPILLPSVKNGSNMLLLFALRSLVLEISLQDLSSTSSTDTLVDVKNPIVSFIRVGDLHRSKSKLINELLNFSSFNTFFHRECEHGSARRLVSNGSIEAAWFQSETEEEFNSRFFTALNLRGDANVYRRQTEFLFQSSMLVVFMVASFELFKELYENVLIDVVSKTKFIVCYVSPQSPENVDERYYDFFKNLSDRGVFFGVQIDWNDGKIMSDVDFTNDLRKTIFHIFILQKISELLNPQQVGSDGMLAYTNVVQNGKNSGFLLDEDRMEYESGKASADKFASLVSKLSPGCKPDLLPLQSEPWRKIGKLERKQRGKSEDKDADDYLIAKTETEKRQQRKLQYRSLFEKNEIAEIFTVEFHRLQENNLLYYLNCCKIKLNGRSRAITSKLLEQYKEKKKKHHHHPVEKYKHQNKLSELELKIENSTIGLEHILREHGQMYEAVISEEIRMKEHFKKAHLTPEIILTFPAIMARLLMTGHSLELMDGDTSNVPITWLKAVFNEIKAMTKNANVFVLSIIGVQSSGKSTLLNALFGLQFPVNSERCTRGINCHLVPVDKESFGEEFDFVLVVDTEGLGSSNVCSSNSCFKDNELATFAIGLADATIINMKGENLAEISNILQAVARGFIRLKKTQAELELMPSCVFVQQNVSAADAEEKNLFCQDKQLMLLDEAIKEAGSKEGFTEITKFSEVFKYDPDLHSWCFPDLWHGRPPKAKTNQDYIEKARKLKQYMMELMRKSSSKLTVSSFSLRMSDLWNAMLHNNFVLCFRNTQEIISGTILNDKISQEVDRFKNLNKLEQMKTRKKIYSFTNIEKLGKEIDNIQTTGSGAVLKNFSDMLSSLKDVFAATDICTDSRQKYEPLLNDIKEEELCRARNETEKDLRVQLKKLENDNDPTVKKLKDRLADLERHTEEVDNDTLNDAEIQKFEETWRKLIVDYKMTVNERANLLEVYVKETINRSVDRLNLTQKTQLNAADQTEIFKMGFVAEMPPPLTENDVIQDNTWQLLALPLLALLPLSNILKRNYVPSNSNVENGNTVLRESHRKWKSQFQNQKDQEFNASIFTQFTSEVEQLLGISRKKHGLWYETVEKNAALPQGYSFTPGFIIKLIKFECNYAYNQSLENGKRFIAMTDPLGDINERHERSIKNFRHMSVEANIDYVSKQVLDFMIRSFASELGELIKAEVCKDESTNAPFKSKRNFLKTIMTNLGKKTHSSSDVKGEKENIFKDFMLYIEMGDSQASEDFFFDVILKLLTEKLITENETKTVVQKMVEKSVGKGVEKAKNALRQAEKNCNGCAKEYVRVFNHEMKVSNIIYLRKKSLPGFTDALLEKISKIYADFFDNANSEFEKLVFKEGKAAIRPLFEKIMGCRERCPFCSAPCSQSLQKHVGDHRAIHYPTGVRGTILTPGLLKGDTIRETSNVNNYADRRMQEMQRKLALDACQTVDDSKKRIRTPESTIKYSRWYHYIFNWNYYSMEDYKQILRHKKWDIAYSRDNNTSLYWKWFMAQYIEELCVHYKAKIPEIPEFWRNITWEEAKNSLDELDIDSKAT